MSLRRSWGWVVRATQLLCAITGFGTIYGATIYLNNTGTCSDANAGTSAGAPLCTPQSAYSKSNPNDTILVTPSTYSTSGLADFNKSGQTWQRANTSGYAVFDYNGTDKTGIYIGAPGVTVDGFKIQNLKKSVDGQFAAFGIFMQAAATGGNGTTLKNNHITIPLGRDCLDNPRPANLDTCVSYADTGCVSCNGGIGWQGGKVDIENNIIRGGFSFGMEPNTTYYAYNRCNFSSDANCKANPSVCGFNCANAAQCPGSSCVTGTYGTTDPGDSGGTIANNQLIYDFSTGECVYFLIEGVGRWDKHGTYLYYGNTMDSPVKGTGRRVPFFTRELGSVAHYFFDNYAHNITNWAILFQEAFGDGNCTTNGGCVNENQAFFNNTFDAGSSIDAGSYGVFWGQCIDSTIKNNIFINFGSGLSYRGPGISTCANNYPSGGGAHDGPGGGLVANNLWYHAGANTTTTGISYQIGSATPVAVNTSSPQFSDMGPFSSNLINAANPNLTSAGLLQAGSNAIAAGTNNPLGQGAGVCSVSDGVRTVNCALDRFGLSRGSSWDIGMHQFGSTPPPTAGAVLIRVSGAGVQF